MAPSYTYLWRKFGVYLGAMLIGFLLAMFGIVTFDMVQRDVQHAASRAVGD